MSEKKQLKILGDRLKKIGVNVMFASNYPWIYLDTVNGKKVKELAFSEHGFTVGFLPIKTNKEFRFADIKTMFKVIRRYV